MTDQEPAYRITTLGRLQCAIRKALPALKFSEAYLATHAAARFMIQYLEERATQYDSEGEHRAAAGLRLEASFLRINLPP